MERSTTLGGRANEELDKPYNYGNSLLLRLGGKVRGLDVLSRNTKSKRHVKAISRR
jgi:hypothetical protein